MNTFMILYVMKCSIYAIVLYKEYFVEKFAKSSIFAHNYDNSKKNNFMIILCMLYVVLYLPSETIDVLILWIHHCIQKRRKRGFWFTFSHSFARISSFWLLPFKTDFPLRSFYWLVKICQIFEKKFAQKFITVC